MNGTEKNANEALPGAPESPAPSREVSPSPSDSAANEPLTMDEAARFIGCSKTTLHKMVHAQGERRIPHYRAGNRVLFRRGTLIAWIAAQERGAA